MNSTQSVAAVLVIGALCGGASAQFSLVAASRSVAAQQATPINNVLGGPWAADQFVYNMVEDPSPFVTPDISFLSGAGGYGRNISDISPATGVMSASLLGRAWDGQVSSTGFGGAYYNVTFSVAEATPISITGGWNSRYYSLNGGTPSALFRLLGPGVSYTQSYTPGGPVAAGFGINFAGVLAPGTYTLNAFVEYRWMNSFGNFGREDSTMEFVARVPAPGAAFSMVAAGGLVAPRRRRA